MYSLKYNVQKIKVQCLCMLDFDTFFITFDPAKLLDLARSRHWRQDHGCIQDQSFLVILGVWHDASLE